MTRRLGAITRRLGAIAPCLAVLAVLGLAAPAGADPPAAGAGSHGHSAPATMSAAPGESAQLDERPRLTIAQEVRRSDHHTAYLGAAVIALGMMVWWNRRRRERFEREDRAAPAARSAHDDDGDALHAAARSNDHAPDGSEQRDSSARPEAGEAREAGETR